MIRALIISAKPPSDLGDLSKRVAEAKAKHAPPVSDKSDGSMLGMAWRLSTEMIVSVLVGGALGYGLDYLFGSKPWIMLIGFGFGFAAGIRSVLRTAEKMDAETAHLPIGKDLNDVEDDDED